MTPGQQAALRDLCVILAGALDIPSPARPCATCQLRHDRVLVARRVLATLAAGPLDPAAVQSAGHTLRNVLRNPDLTCETAGAGTGVAR